MSYPHSIRLRGPWEFEPLARTLLRADGSIIEQPGKVPPAGRAQLPCDWSATLGREFRGRVRYRRRFNRPTGLGPHERVFLVVEGVDAFGSVALNDRPLGPIRGYAVPASFDVTDLLAASNLLAVDVESPEATSGAAAPLRPGRETAAGGPIDEVRLEVRSLAWIEGLAVWTQVERGAARLHVAGRAAGESAGKLSVVVNGLERELAYGEVRCGDTLSLSAPVADLPLWPALAETQASAVLEIKLLGTAGALWQAQRPVTLARVTYEPDSGRWTVAGAALEEPAESLTIDEVLRDEKPSQAGRRAVELSEIGREELYDLLDRGDRPVFQHVPPAWAEDVCPRLAHHAAIVAWTAPAVELQRIGKEFLDNTSYGRPWLAAAPRRKANP